MVFFSLVSFAPFFHQQPLIAAQNCSVFGAPKKRPSKCVYVCGVRSRQFRIFGWKLNSNYSNTNKFMQINCMNLKFHYVFAREIRHDPGFSFICSFQASNSDLKWSKHSTHPHIDQMNISFFFRGFRPANDELITFTITSTTFWPIISTKLFKSSSHQSGFSHGAHQINQIDNLIVMNSPIN